MEVSEFCKKIGLGETERQMVQNGLLSENTWRRYWMVYQENHRKFFEEILNKEYPAKWFLILYCYFACETYEEYRRLGIEEGIFWDTFRDIAYWCENGKAEYGVTGICEYQWFWRHFDLTLFRLGRLEFEQTLSQWEAAPCPEKTDGLHPGEPVISVHIPQGSPLEEAACEASLARARQWFGADKPYVCYSWLLHSSLEEILGEDSRIRHFARRFRIIYTDNLDRDGERRIFGRCLDDPADYPANTSLQRKARKYLMDGKPIGEALGIMRTHRSMHRLGDKKP